MGVGSLWAVKAGDERAGDGIPKGLGSGRYSRKLNFSTLRNFSRRKKHTEAGTTNQGGGNREYKVREAGNSDPPVHKHSIVS